MKLHLVNDQPRSSERPKLGLGYISSYLKKYCDDIEISVSFSGDDTIGIIKKLKPDIAGLTATTETFNDVINLGRDIKESLKLPLLLGGTHITILPDYLPEWFDAGVIGEGEQTILEIVELYRNQGVLVNENIKGIIYRDGQHVIRTDERELIDPLDRIPSPDWDMLGLSSTGPGHIITSRGCTYKCVFCASSAIWKKIRFFSPEYVVNEIKTIVEKFGRQEILIYDDLFTANKKRVRRISDLICQEGLDRSVSFECLSNVNHFSQDTAQYLKKMNVQRISFGMESGSPAMLEYLKKGTVTKEKIQSAVKAGVDNGLEVLGSFMVGIPGETEKDMMMTYDFIKELRLTETGINVATPFPGTELWNYAVDNGFIENKWDESIYAMKTITPETIKDKRLLCSMDKSRFIDIYKNMIDLDSMMIDRRIKTRTLKEMITELFEKGNYSASKLRVLDVNCEDGTLGAAIKSRMNAEVVGLNPEPDYIDDCERRLNTVIRGGIDELRSSYEDGYFDVIILNETLPDDEMLELYHTFLSAKGCIAGSFVNSNHMSYTAYSLFGISKPSFETTDGTIQYLNWGIPDKDKYPGYTLHELQRLMKDSGYRISSLYDFQSIENNLTRQICGSSVNMGSENNIANESLVIRYFFAAHKMIAEPEIDNVNKTLIHDNREGMKSRADSVSIKKKCDAIALEALVPENVQRVLSLGRKGNEIGKKLRERGINEVIGVISERPSFDPVSAEYKEVICGSIEEIDLPYDNGYFDCIIIENTLEYLKDPIFALKKLKHYLSDSGSVIAVIPNTGNIFKINKLVDGQWNFEDMNRSCEAPLRFFTRKEIEKLFIDAGFELSGLSAGAISQEYQEIEITASNDISAGRVILKGLNPEEIRDMYTVNFLIRAVKKGAEYKKLLDNVTEFFKDDRMAEAEEVVEEYLETYLADIDALILHADISFRRGSYDRAVQSLDKILLFDPGRKDAIELKSKIQHADSSACLD